MTLETIIYPQGQIGNFGYDYDMLQEDHIFGGLILDQATNNYTNNHQVSESVNELHWGGYSSSSSGMHVKDQWEDYTGGDVKMESPAAASMVTDVGRRKRRRTKSTGKNKEELENQRMTHIKVERNRRKQMNEYLAIIRSLMPSSYVQRGDQASIVGGAINFVKELEQQLQTLEVQIRAINGYSPPRLHPFSDFFTFPQYSSHRTSDCATAAGGSATTAKNRLPAMAEIEVTMVESQANIKILSKKRHSQLLRMVVGLQCLRLTILHLNVTVVEEMVLYTVSVKHDDGCQLSTVDDIADAVNCLLCKIEQESLRSS